MTQVNIKHVMIQIIILYIFFFIVKHEPHMINYKDETQFNMYRSLMCISFAILSLYNTINNFSLGFNNPFKYHNNDYNMISNLFISYIIIDLFHMGVTKNKRFDLYIHHIWCLISFFLAQHYNHCGFFHNFLLFSEIISIVSGIDSIYREEGDDYNSMLCKKFRKNIIKYIRLPIWIILFLFTIKYMNKIPRILFYNGLISSVIMLCLDRYWEKQCDKIINKYD